MCTSCSIVKQNFLSLFVLSLQKIHLKINLSLLSIQEIWSNGSTGIIDTYLKSRRRSSSTVQTKDKKTQRSKLALKNVPLIGEALSEDILKQKVSISQEYSFSQHITFID